MSETMTLAQHALARAERRRREQEEQRSQREEDRKRREREEAEEATAHLRKALTETFGNVPWEMVWWDKGSNGVVAVFTEPSLHPVHIWANGTPAKVTFSIAEKRNNRWQTRAPRLGDLADLGDHLHDLRRPKGEVAE